MNPTDEQRCLELIDDYLDEQLTEEQRDEFETHLGDCESCQVELESRAAAPEIWRDAVALLGEDVSTSDDQANATSADAQQRAQRLGRVLNLLGPTDDPEMLGRVGEYEISGVVGHGGMGAVLKGFDKSLRRVVAIKVMAPHLADSGSARQRFQREARAAAAITHDNVIATYGVAEANGLPYLVMPFARGPSLQRRIDESGPLSAVEVVRIGRQIAAGLAAAHEQGLVHRDIKPANILLNEGVERLWITDFGVARAVDDASMTQTGVIAGTPQYMSPEQARGEAVGQASDLFSMGSVLYTACTGRPPFRAEAAYGILRRITDTQPRPIQELNPDIPVWLCGFIERLMAKEAAARFESAADVAHILEGYLAHLQQPDVIDAPTAVPPFASPPAALPASAAAETATAAQPQTLLKRILTRSLSKATLGAVATVLLAVFAWQATAPPEISGDWQGEVWPRIKLATVRNADGWYTGEFTDNSGAAGAIQLEWSRLQRRYVGRWKMGDGVGGALTLRAADGRISGAVAVDAETATPDSMARLRDFLWTPGTGTVPSVKPAVSNRRPISLEAPITGRISRWADGIRPGVAVRKGDVLIEIEMTDAEMISRLEDQKQQFELWAESNERVVEASRQRVTTSHRDIDSKKKQLEAMQTAADQIAASGQALIKAAEQKLQIEQEAVDGAVAVLKTLETEHARNETLLKESVISEVKFQMSGRKVAEQKAALATAKSNLKSVEIELISHTREAQAKNQKAAGDVLTLEGYLNKAESDLADAEAELAKAHGELARSRKELLEMKVKLARHQAHRIIAPEDAFIERLAAAGQLVKPGDMICVLATQSSSSSPTLTLLDAPAKADSLSAEARRFRPRDIASISGQPLSAAAVSDSIETALSLMERFKRHMPPGGFTEEDLPQANAEQTAAWRDRQTALEILTSQMESTSKRLDSQAAMKNQIKAQIEMGTLPSDSLLYRELDVLMGKVQLEHLVTLRGYYGGMGKGDDTPSDQQLAVELLQSYQQAAAERMDVLAQIRNIARRRFEVGDIQANDVSEAEQAEAAAAAELETASALLRHYGPSTKAAPAPEKAKKSGSR